MMHWFLSLATVLALLSSSNGWEYADMDTWADEFEYCGGSFQSPIEVDSSEVTKINRCDEGPYIEWELESTHMTVTATNRGSSLYIHAYDEESGVDLNKNFNTVARFHNPLYPMESDYEYYCLGQVHFHWGHDDSQGSEHVIDGGQYAAEVHLVHYACDFDDINAAFQASETVNDHRTLGVIGVFLEVDDESHPLGNVVDAPDAGELTEESDHIRIIVPDFDFSQLMPEKKDFYHYQGSLTNPPCNPIVNWFVMDDPKSMAEEELEFLRHLINEDHHFLSDNWRPPQEKEGRPVYHYKDCSNRGNGNGKGKGKGKGNGNGKGKGH